MCTETEDLEQEQDENRLTKEEAEYEEQYGNPDHGLMPWEIEEN